MADSEDVQCMVVGETSGCWKLQRSTDAEPALFPKSEVVFKRRNVKTGQAVANIPAWLLEDRSW